MNKRSNKKSETIAAGETGGLFYQGHIYQDILTKKELWNEMAAKYNGNFRMIRTKGNDLNRFRLELTYRNFELILEESDAKPLKFEVFLPLNIDFEFTISWEDTLAKIFKWFGKKEIKTGHKDFDEKYLVKSNNEQILLRLDNASNLSQVIFESDIYLMNLTKLKQLGNFKLMTVKDRTTKDITVIRELIELHFGIIDFFINNRLIVNK